MSSPKAEELLRAARAVMKQADYCFFISHGKEGEIHSRLMHPFEPDDDFTIWLGASPDSRKAREIRTNNHTTLSYMNPRTTGYVTILGTATLEGSVDLRYKYWRAYWSDMYPGRPENMDYILIKVVPHRIEMMNFEESALPQPYGLKPVGLARKDTEWSLIESANEL